MLNTTTNTYTDSLLILSWNVNGLKNHKDEILFTLQDKRIDIALISDTHFKNIYFLHLPGHRLHQTNHQDGTTHTGAAIYVRLSLTSHPLPKFKL